ncbi:MAG: cytochrome B [Bacteroidia bacterium]
MDTLFIALKHSHNLLRWFVLLTAVYAVVRHALGFFGKKAYTTDDGKSSLFYMIACDVQLLVALALYVVRPQFSMLFTDTKMVMQDANLRFFAVEHNFILIIAIALVHIGHSRMKKMGDDNSRFKTGFIFFALSLAIILYGIPWDKALMPGM